MAIRTAARVMPDALRGRASRVLNFDRSAGTGTVVVTVQLIAYDDAQIPDIASANHGDPAVERLIVVLDEDEIQADLGVIGQMTPAQAKAFWDQALQTWYQGYSTPALARLARAGWVAKKTSGVLAVPAQPIPS